MAEKLNDLNNESSQEDNQSEEETHQVPNVTDYTNKIISTSNSGIIDKQKIKNKKGRVSNKLNKETDGNKFNNTTSQGFSGTDIKAVFRFPDEMNVRNFKDNQKHKVTLKFFAELSTVSYSTFRDKFPVRALGHTKAKGYTNGSRTIGGTLIFKMLNKHMINKMLDNLSSLDSKKVNILPDELPPFDIDITFSNELGESSKVTIVGVEITEGNQIMSVQKINTNEKYSFVAQDLVMIDTDNARQFELKDKQSALNSKLEAVNEVNKSYTPITEAKSLSEEMQKELNKLKEEGKIEELGNNYTVADFKEDEYKEDMVEYQNKLDELMDKTKNQEDGSLKPSQVRKRNELLDKIDEEKDNLNYLYSEQINKFQSKVDEINNKEKLTDVDRQKLEMYNNRLNRWQNKKDSLN